jgi:transposase-like protein
MKDKKNKLEEDDVQFLIDLLLETNSSISAIARQLDVSVNEVNKKINQLGLSWLKESRKKMSRGQTALTQIMQKILPGEEIVNEYHIDDRLRFDVYCPSYKLAAEYHGRQHFFYTSRFFESKYEFEEAQKRDEKKVQYCKDNGIALIVFRYNDSLTEDSVYNRMLEAIRSSDYISDKKQKKSLTDNPFYNEAKKKNSEYRKSLYRKIKGSKIDDNRRNL